MSWEEKEKKRDKSAMLVIGVLASDAILICWNWVVWVSLGNEWNDIWVKWNQILHHMVLDMVF